MAFTREITVVEKVKLITTIAYDCVIHEGSQTIEYDKQCMNDVNFCLYLDISATVSIVSESVYACHSVCISYFQLFQILNDFGFCLGWFFHLFHYGKKKKQPVDYFSEASNDKRNVIYIYANRNVYFKRVQQK